MAFTTAILGVAAAGAQTYSQVKQGQAQKKAAQQVAQAQTDAQAKQLADQQAQDAKAAANDTRAQAAADLQRRRAAVGGRSSTILTSGQGLTTAAPTAGKQYLGL